MFMTEKDKWGTKLSVSKLQKGEETRYRLRIDWGRIEYHVGRENRGSRWVLLSWNGNVLDCEDSVERAVRARVAVAWTKWRENGGLLPIKSIQLKVRGSVYESCVRSGMLYTVLLEIQANKFMGIGRPLLLRVWSHPWPLSSTFHLNICKMLWNRSGV